MHWIPGRAVISVTECMHAALIMDLTGLLQSPLSRGKHCIVKYAIDIWSIFCASVSISRNCSVGFFEKKSIVEKKKEKGEYEMLSLAEHGFFLLFFFLERNPTGCFDVAFSITILKEQNTVSKLCLSWIWLGKFMTSQDHWKSWSSK